MTVLDAAKAIREKAAKTAGRVSPPAERFRVERVEPTIELVSVHSDVRIREGDEDVDFPRGFRDSAVRDDLVAVVSDQNGDRFVVALAKPGEIAADPGAGGTSFIAGAGLVLAAGELFVGEGTGINVLSNSVEVDVSTIAERSWVLAGLANYATVAALAGKQDLSAKDQPNGYAGLDAGGFLPTTRLADVTAFIRGLLDDATAAAARATLDVPSNAEAILDAIGDAKGDLIGFSAPDTPARKAVGAEGKTLKSRASDSLGIAWEDAIPKGTSFPASPADGDPFIRTDTGFEGLYLWNAAAATWLFQGSGKAAPYWRAYQSTTQSPASGAQIAFDAESDDPGSIYNTATKQATPTKPGRYFIHAVVVGPVLAADTYARAELRRNGVVVARGQPHIQRGTNERARCAVSDLVYSDGDDTFDVVIVYDGASFVVPAGLDATAGRFVGYWVSNDSAGGVVTPKVRAYRTSNGSAIASLASPILFSAESYDDGDCFDPATGLYTAKVAGKYAVDAAIRGAGTYAPGTLLGLHIYKNGVSYAEIDAQLGLNVADANILSGSDEVPLAVGDTLGVRVYISTGNFTPYGAAGGENTHLAVTYAAEPGGVIVPETFRVIGAASQPAYTNGWASAGGGEPSVAFMKDPFGFVWMRGTLASGTGSTTAFTLPAGYRPAGVQRFACYAGGTISYVYVDSGGLVQPITNPSSLDTIRFKAEN